MNFEVVDDPKTILVNYGQPRGQIYLENRKSGESGQPLVCRCVSQARECGVGGGSVDTAVPQAIYKISDALNMVH